MYYFYQRAPSQSGIGKEGKACQITPSQSGIGKEGKACQTYKISLQL